MQPGFSDIISVRLQQPQDLQILILHGIGAPKSCMFCKMMPPTPLRDVSPRQELSVQLQSAYAFP